VAFSADDDRLASADDGGVVKVWDAAPGREAPHTYHGNGAWLCPPVFLPDGNLLAAACGDRQKHVRVGELRALDVAAGREAFTAWLWERPAPPPEVGVTPKGYTAGTPSSADPEAYAAPATAGGPYFAAGRGPTIKLWEAATGREVHRLALGNPQLRDRKTWVRGLALSPDGGRLAAIVGEAVKVWDTDSAAEVRTLPWRSELLTGVAFGPGGRIAAAGGDAREGVIVIWDAASGDEVVALRGRPGPVLGLAFSADGARLASVSRDGSAVIWDVASGREAVRIRGHAEPARGVAFSPDGGRLATAGDDATVRVWDAEGGRELLTLRGHTAPVHAVAFSPGGEFLASAGANGAVKVWDGRPWDPEAAPGR
jgi:WD40 repeat protein